MLEPLLKQVWILIEKEELSQIHPEQFTLNTMDFSFFLNIAQHPKFTANNALKLLQIVLFTSRKNIMLTRISLKMILLILNKFKKNAILTEFCQQQIKIVLKIIFEQDGRKLEVYHSILRNKSDGSKKPVAATKESKFSTLTSSKKITLSTKASSSPSKDAKQRKNNAIATLDQQKAFIDDGQIQDVFKTLQNKKFQEESR